jgi:hypothetical protein
MGKTTHNQTVKEGGGNDLSENFLEAGERLAWDVALKSGGIPETLNNVWYD